MERKYKISRHFHLGMMKIIKYHFLIILIHMVSHLHLQLMVFIVVYFKIGVEVVLDCHY